MPLLLYHSFYAVFHVLLPLTNTAYWILALILLMSQYLTVSPFKMQYILILFKLDWFIHYYNR